VTGSSASRSSVSRQSLSLAANSVHLWLCRQDAVSDPALQEAYPQILSDAERQRCDDLRPHLRGEALLARVLVRTVLSAYAGIEPEAWNFETSLNGKPHIAQPQACGLEFNVSHSHGWLVCAVSRDAAVGVDVERCDAQRDFMRLARRYFRPEELLALEARQGESQRALFYELWTLKEAWSKARGHNIGSSMGAVGFSLDTAGKIEISQSGEAFPADCWSLVPAPDFRLALCRAGQSSAPPQLQVFETVPLRGYRPLELPAQASSGAWAGMT
jgi:4'-phosphopantetheinyl transferase